MKKTLMIGADPFPPYQYYNNDGNVVGTDYEVVIQALKKAGYDFEIILDEWSNIEKMVSNNELDAVFQVQSNDERQKRYYFSNLLRSAVTQTLTGDENLVINNYDDIIKAELTIGVIENYSYGEHIDNIDSKFKRTYKTQDELLKDISLNKVDIGIFDKGVKEYLMKKNNIKSIYSIDNLEFQRELYVIFNDEKLRDDFNKNLVD